MRHEEKCARRNMLDLAQLKWMGNDPAHSLHSPTTGTHRLVSPVHPYCPTPHPLPHEETLLPFFPKTKNETNAWSHGNNSAQAPPPMPGTASTGPTVGECTSQVMAPAGELSWDADARNDPAQPRTPSWNVERAPEGGAHPYLAHCWGQRCKRRWNASHASLTLTAASRSYSSPAHPPAGCAGVACAPNLVNLSEGKKGKRK